MHRLFWRHTLNIHRSSPDGRFVIEQLHRRYAVYDRSSRNHLNNCPTLYDAKQWAEHRYHTS